MGQAGGQSRVVPAIDHRGAELSFARSAGQPVIEQLAASLDTGQHAPYVHPAAGLPLHLTQHGGDVVLVGE